MGRVVIPGFRKIETSGGSGEGGTTNYNDLTNKPFINNVPLVGNLKTVDLKLTDATLTEEGVPAEAKTVGQKLEEQSTSLTALSGQLGNYTVKSDVPENAVFTDTVYDDTEVKESISQQSREIQDALNEVNSNLLNQKMLGWTVPEEMPINNYVDSNGVFHQRVGRVDLGTLDWSYSSEYKRFSTRGITDYKNKDSGSNTWVADAFLKGYSTTSGNNTASDSYNKSIGFNGTSNIFFVKNTSYTDTTTFKNAMQGQYLYYELEEEKTIKVDGNEAVTNINDSLDDYGLNNVFDGVIIRDNANVVRTNKYPCSEGNIIKFKYDGANCQFSGINCYDSSGKKLGGIAPSYQSDGITFTASSGTASFDCEMYSANGFTVQGHIGVYINNQIDKIKNDLEKLNSLPVGTVLQLESDKDIIQTTTEKYGWQYLGTSNIQYDNGSSNLLVTNVYRKNN